ncbi:MAG TPA: T9SS type A sorting domain-containing protein [Candidatus Cloacimonadota bacterium]|nr:T9SS type A sorting domain-containing protein [Candidatus Cloacimonadota bacterium]
MKRISLVLILLLFAGLIWAGFDLENFNDASAWEGYTINTNYPYYNVMTFNGNNWKFYDVVKYTSGSDYELELHGSNSGKVSSHYFENGVGTITFSAAKLSDVSTDIKVLYSNNDNYYTQVIYNYNMYVTISSTSSLTYNIPVNQPEAHYIRIQAHYGNVRIDDISVSDEFSVVIPTVTVASVTDITKFTASGGGNVTSDGGGTVTARGICWNSSEVPHLSNCGDNYTVDGTGTGSFTSALTGLDANTSYRVRAYATNSAGTAYSEFNFPAQFTTDNYVAPTATTNNASDVNHVFAHLNGIVNGDEASTTVVFEYGLTDSYGSEVTADQSPLAGAGDQFVQAALHELNEFTTYHYRVKATNVIGTTYGDDMTFTTTNNPNQTSTQSIPAATPDPDPIDFTGTGVTIDFSGVSGATGSDDVTVDQFNEPPTSLTGLIGSEVNVAGSSYLFTNHTGFVFSAVVQFLVDELTGINTAFFSDMEDGEQTDIKLWKRPEYGSGEFVNQGYLSYNDGTDNVNNTPDDYLYLEGVGSFSEVTFTSDEDHPLPVTLSGFSVRFADNENIISWITQSETDNLGWNLYRSENPEGWLENNVMQLNTGIIAGAGTTSTPTQYEFIDDYSLVEEHTYFYWLESISYGQEIEMVGSVSITIPTSGETPAIAFTRLSANYPNPFNPSTRMRLSISDNQMGRLTIYNIRGELIFEQNFSAGEHEFTWNADRFPSGIYFYKLASDNYSRTRKMILLK